MEPVAVVFVSADIAKRRANQFAGPQASRVGEIEDETRSLRLCLAPYVASTLLPAAENLLHYDIDTR